MRAATDKRIRSAVCMLLVAVIAAMPWGMGHVTVHAEETKRTFDIGLNPGAVTATLDAEGKLTLSGVGETKDYTAETAPFAAVADQIVSLEIGPGVVTLGNHLFYNCGSLTGNLELPEKLVRMGNRVFSGDNAQKAPKLMLVINSFQEASVARLKTEMTASSPMPSVSPSVSPETEGAAGKISSEKSYETGSQGAERENTSQTPEVPAGGAKESASQEEPEAGNQRIAAISPVPTESPESSAASFPSPEEPQGSPVPTVPPSGDPAPSPSPSVTPGTENDGNRYNIETITQQEIGVDVFFSSPENASRYFTCSQGNGSFRAAMEQAGYTEADSVVSAVFDCGEGTSATGGSVTFQLAQAGGAVTLPPKPAQFSPPEGGDLFAYTFSGWTESQDDANVTRRPGSSYAAEGRSDLYFIAGWDRDVLLKIQVERTHEALRLSLPTIEGYDVTSCQWQVCETPAGQELPSDQDSLSWEDVAGATAPEYVRILAAGDEDRLFRCVVTVAKQGFLRALFGVGREEELALEAVRGVAAVEEDAVSFLPGSYSDASGSTVISGTMDPRIVRADGKAMVPECGFFVESSSAALVFCGWKDQAGNHYDPGDLAAGGTVLEAQWDVPAKVIYVDQASEDDPASDGSKERPCSMAKAFYLLSEGGDQTAETALYRNVIVLTADFTAPQELSKGGANGKGNTVYDLPFTLTAQAPGETNGGYTLTLAAGEMFLYGDARFENIAIGAGGGSLYARTKRLVMGKGVECSGLTLYGADSDTALTGDTEMRVFSGTYTSLFGGGSRKALTGNTKIVVGGEAFVSNIYGGGDQSSSSVSGSTGILLGGGNISGSVYGGGKSGAVSGSSSVEMRGGAVSGSLFGGGDQGAVAQGSAVSVSGGTVKENVYGGGKGVSGSPETGAVTGRCSVTITGGELGTYSGSVGGTFDPATGSVYGGGEFARVKGDTAGTLGTTDVTIDVQNDAGRHPAVGGSVYGGSSQAEVQDSSKVNVRDGRIGGSVYGGGFGSGSKVDSTTVTVSAGSIGGNVYGGGAEGTVSSDATVTIGGGSMHNVFAAGEGSQTAGVSAGRVGGSASLIMSGGTVTAGLYGGGYLGVVGSGSDVAADAAVTDSNTQVTLSGGSVNQVFGGGNGSGSDPALGTVFGHTSVTVTGGMVSGSVYGGSNYAFVTGNTQVTLQGTCTVGGSVYGGGNLKRDPEDGFDNASFPVLGNAELILDGADGLAVAGSVFGSGNLTCVQGAKTLLARNLSGKLQSIQRMSLVKLENCNLTLAGADDITGGQGTKLFSLTKVDDLHLTASTLCLEEEVSELGALGNYDASGSVSSDGAFRSTLRAVPGLFLQIMPVQEANGAGKYGPVSGVLWLELAGAAEGGKGVRIEADETGNVGNGSADTGAFLKKDSPANQGIEMVSGTVSGSHSFWRLGGPVLERKVTISAPRREAGGQAVAVQSFDVPTSMGSTVYKITNMKKTSGNFTLVRPVEENGGMTIPDRAVGQQAGNTFALRIDPTDSENRGTWDTAASDSAQWGAYVLTQLPAGETAWNSGVDGVWNRGDASPTTSSTGTGAGNNAQFTCSLVYDSGYEDFMGGELELTFQEYRAGNSIDESARENTVLVKVTLEGDEGETSQSAFVERGRKFGELTSKIPVTITEAGAVTAFFTTHYYPAAVGAGNSYLTLCAGETAVPVGFPAGTCIVLADSTTADHRYYFYQTSAGEEKIKLSGFTSMGGAGSAVYPGPTDITGPITEKLLFAVDFSRTENADRLAQGQYSLRLTHSQGEALASAASAGFSIATGQAAVLTLEIDAGGSLDTLLSLDLTPQVSEADTRYADGACVDLFLTDSEGNQKGFPSKMQVGGAAGAVLHSTDGTVSFALPASGTSRVTLDFSGVPESMLASGSYQVTAGLRPKVGLQMGSNKGAADCETAPMAFSLNRPSMAKRAVGVQLKDETKRLADASEADFQMEFNVSAQMESGDSLVAEVFHKTGSTPQDSSYTHFSGAESWCILGTFSGGKADAVLTVPKGTESGTYRVVFQVVDSGGTVLAEEPYNFIVK